MQLIEIAEQIQQVIKEIRLMRQEIRPRSQDVVNAKKDYYKAYTKILIGLKNGKEYEIDGEIIKNPPAASVKEIAKGIIWETALALDQAEAMYQSVIKNIDTAKTELDGLRSLNKHLEIV